MGRVGRVDGGSDTRIINRGWGCDRGGTRRYGAEARTRRRTRKRSRVLKNRAYWDYWGWGMGGLFKTGGIYEGVEASNGCEGVDEFEVIHRLGNGGHLGIEGEFGERRVDKGH